MPQVEQTVTYSAPTEVRTEYLLIFVLIVLTITVIYMSHIHNDSLAAKFSDFIYGDLGALWGLTTSGRSGSSNTIVK